VPAAVAVTLVREEFLEVDLLEGRPDLALVDLDDLGLLWRVFLPQALLSLLVLELLLKILV